MESIKIILNVDDNGRLCIPNTELGQVKKYQVTIVGTLFNFHL